MHGNAFFSIGKSHPICQDYACATMIGETPLILLSDGCSSSPNTDTGARLLTHTVARLIHANCLTDCPEETFPIDREGVEKLCWGAIQMLANQTGQLGLSTRCLDATLLMAYVINGFIYIIAYGDGTFCFRYQDGLKQIHRLNFPSGAPRYLSYDLSPERLAQYEQEYGTEFLLESDEWVEQIEHPFFFGIYDVENITSVSLLSDGCETFEETSAKDAVEELTAFKNYKGVFVERRVRRALKTFAKNNIAHHDDVSVASIYLES